MDREISDEQLDRIAQNLLKDFALNDEALDEIAESPKLWWNVRNQIEAEKNAARKKMVFCISPANISFWSVDYWILLRPGVLFLNSKDSLNSPIAEVNPVQNNTGEIVRKPESPTVEKAKNDSENPESSKKSNYISEKVSARKVEPKTKFVAKNQKPETPAKPLNNSQERKILPEAVVAETKTDFIALSYAANIESGQIVRVKVPSAMMVSLGVKTNIEKESEFVNAEVIVGDDGAARAIRFIR